MKKIIVENLDRESVDTLVGRIREKVNKARKFRIVFNEKFDYLIFFSKNEEDHKCQYDSMEDSVLVKLSNYGYILHRVKRGDTEITYEGEWSNANDPNCGIGIFARELFKNAGR